MIFVKYFDISTTMPPPTTWPDRDVPAVLGIRETALLFANLINSLRSAILFGLVTANGTSRYTEASVACARRDRSSRKISHSNLFLSSLSLI